MTETDAAQIAKLLNDRNQLAKAYTQQAVLADAGNYEYEVRAGQVAGCVERKRVQWYQWEIRHLSVGKDFEGQGVAFVVYGRAEAAAIAGGACILQCTIRRGNQESEKFFRRQGFTEVNTFYYDRTRNSVGVWQKVLRASEDRAERR